MLYCLGLFAGYVIGTIFGGLWAFINPGVGFVAGLIGDTKLLHGFTKKHEICASGCHESGHVQHKNIEGTAKDLVCSMSVSEKTSKHKTNFRGKTYFSVPLHASPYSIKIQKFTSKTNGDRGS